MLVLKLKKVFPFLLLSFPVVIDIINGYLRGTDGTSESFIGYSLSWNNYSIFSYLSISY